MKEYEKLDKEIFGICRKAETKCRVTVSGRYEWSPASGNAIKTLSYWRARKKYQTHTNAVVKKLGEVTGIIYEHHTDAYIQQRIEQCRSELRTIQDNDAQHRRDHLEALASKYARENNISKETAISELISHESVRVTFSLLRDHENSTKRTIEESLDSI